jgi:hypothetical protein
MFSYQSQPAAPNAPAAMPAVLTGTDGASASVEPAEGDQGGDPINRGLLLKFLSSVRS